MIRSNLRAFVVPVLLFFTLSTITAPARAVLPLIAAGVAFMTEGGMAVNGLAALTVGTVAGMVYLGNLQSGQGNTAGSFLDVPLSTSRDRPMDTPSGWTAPVNNNAQPMPSASLPAPTMWKTAQVGAAPIYSSADAACSAWKPYATYVYGGTVQITPPYGKCLGTDTYDGSNTWWYVSSELACGAGYTLSGSSCVLSNASLVMKPADGRCQILMNVSGFVVDPQDPECGGLAAQTGTTVAPGKITQTKPGSFTNGTVTINPDGSRTIVYSSANTANNTTTITTVNMIPDAGGQTAMVTGSSVVVVAGTGTAASTGTAPLNIDFPDDYNREATQAQIKTGIDTVHGDLDASGFALPAPSAITPEAAAALEVKKVTDVLDASVASYDNFKLLDWSTWIPVLPAAGCTPFTGTVAGRPISIDICPKIALLNELLGWLLSVFALWSVVSMMFRKD